MRSVLLETDEEHKSQASLTMKYVFVQQKKKSLDKSGLGET